MLYMLIQSYLLNNISQKPISNSVKLSDKKELKKRTTHDVFPHFSVGKTASVSAGYS